MDLPSGTDLVPIPWVFNVIGQSVRFSSALTLVTAASSQSLSEAADRLQVTAPPAGQDAAEKLVGSLASSYNAGGFVRFMDHFTPSQKSRICRRMEDIFDKHEPKMDIRTVTLLSENEDTIPFAVRYAWHDKDRPEEVLASKATARRVNGAWKLDGQQVKAVTCSSSGADYSAGDVGVAPAAWDPFNPPANQIDPDLKHLRGDIGIRSDRGCANGRCGR